ncbi:MAG: protein-L-isoaspartate(D-aspartate) O-methyltransferase [Candidatus Hydrothermarchaeales archaeon]
MERRDVLVDRLISLGYLKTPAVISAMRSVKREFFLPHDFERYAYEDSPLPIGGEQTISAPHMVAIMCEAAELSRGQRVLEIGAGSGYHACVTAHVTKSMVYSIERLTELARSARANLNRAGCRDVRVIEGDGTEGYEKEAPYDRIIVTAAAPSVPPRLIDQLTPGGKLLIPVGSRYSQELLRITKEAEGVRRESLGGCVFVPLIGKHGWKG